MENWDSEFYSRYGRQENQPFCCKQGVYANYVSILTNPEFAEPCRWLMEPFLVDGNRASNHDLALMLSREDSFIDNGIKATLESVHIGHIESSFMFRIVALQKQDSQSTKCRLDVLLSNIKCFIVSLLVCILLYVHVSF